MAKTQQHVWGIEIGQSAIKALRCHLEGDEVQSDAFDFVEYPKLLSQPESEPELLVADALEQFLSRNDLKNCKVAISVPGQSGLSKFFKPPPVEVKKIPDLVKFEARGQIPFDLDDVIWDFQQMPGGQVADGYALETEVGLFAMKKEAVFRALKPFRERGIDIDVIQLAPMAMYSMFAYDKFSDRLATEEYDPEHPPKYTVLLSIGTDSSDLIVTNGFRVWQRNMPIGGTHFTRQLTKDLKLTFAKAEHLKKNAMQADDPKLIFQAMRPVFGDFVTEVQRSLGFFQQQNRKAEIDDVYLLGNTVKLPGLVPYLNKNLEYEVHTLDKFDRLSGESIGSPTYKENQPSYGVVYGLCVQQLKRGPIKTNLIPREVVVERVVRAKKPWAVAAAALLLAGLVLNFTLFYFSYSYVNQPEWSSAESAADSTKQSSDTEKSEDEARLSTVRLLTKIGEEVSGNSDRRILWNELLKVIYEGLNRDPELAAKGDVSPEELPYSERKDFHFTSIDSKFQDKLNKWFDDKVETKFVEQYVAREVQQGRMQAGETLPPEVTATFALDGPGWVVEVEGYHYYNANRNEEGDRHVRRYLLEFLENGSVLLPNINGEPTEFTMKEMGISHAFVISSGGMNPDYAIPNPKYYEALEQMKAKEDQSDNNNNNQAQSKPEPVDENGRLIPKEFKVSRYDFKLQFVWRETLLSERLRLKAEQAEAESQATPAVGTELQTRLPIDRSARSALASQ